MCALALCVRSHKLMRTTGINDFTVKDVLYPERGRLRRNLSAVINFAKFREDRMERYQEFTAEAEGFVNQKQALEAENNKLLTEIRAINAQRASEEPRVQELEAENAQVAAQIAGLNQQQAAMKEAAQALKARWQEVGDQISETKYKLLNAKQEQDHLRAQIVPSPEKLKQVRGRSRGEWRRGASAHARAAPPARRRGRRCNNWGSRSSRRKRTSRGATRSCASTRWRARRSAARRRTCARCCSSCPTWRRRRRA